MRLQKYRFFYSCQRHILAGALWPANATPSTHLVIKILANGLGRGSFGDNISVDGFCSLEALDIKSENRWVISLDNLQRLDGSGQQ